MSSTQVVQRRPIMWLLIVLLLAGSVLGFMRIEQTTTAHSAPNASSPSVFPPDDTHVLARFTFNGHVEDVSGNQRHATLIGGEFVSSRFGQGLLVGQAASNGIDWSAYANLLAHPYTIEMVLTPEETQNWRKLFGFSDTADAGWYYRSQGFQAYPHPTIGSNQLLPNQRHYLAIVSTAANQIEVYFQGALIGTTNASFTAPPQQALFFRDDVNTGRREQLVGVIEGLRISATTRTAQELTAAYQRLAALEQEVFVQKRADRTLINAGEDLTYTLRLTNPQASSVTVTEIVDQLPAGFRYQTGSTALLTTSDPQITEQNSAQQLRWAGPFTLPGQSFIELRFQVAISPNLSSGTYRNSAYATLQRDGNLIAALPALNAAPVVIPPPTAARNPSATTEGGSVTVDPATGRPTISLPRGNTRGVLFTTQATCPTPPGGEPTSVVLLHNGYSYAMQETPPASGTYAVTIPANQLANAAIHIVVTCSGDTEQPIENEVGQVQFYDPSGIIFDAATGNPLTGATVTLYRVPGAEVGTGCLTVETRPAARDEREPWSGVADHVPGANDERLQPDLDPPQIRPAQNPQITNNEGRYGWDVVTGCWYIQVSAPGYQSRVSPLVGVPPEVTDLHLGLTPRSSEDLSHVFLPVIVR
ncbi:DUF11 domain-containing protein [Candidatus Viridilinea mediisalina]|uniref:DUF11 domain-containing protein n=1 Tax=Candidatus Viridilinea mediisalina TaxID=2024553 RepID=A0A2A6RDH8_9CHLR|nr:DUF11 domain-containing protein [Candidatus Viridilinea mediisalina]PDV99539.1 hypothetical protein CJ255_21485 [Candidatus Viridilinea mediisalina]